MSEVCSDVPAAAAAAEGKCDAGSRAARRRRIEIRRLRLAAERGAEEVVSRKRRKLEPEASTDEEEDVVEEIEPATYGVTSVCGRRRDMEDAVSIRPEFLPGHHFFGVFDGHGCSHVATSCGERMHEIVAEEALSSGSASGGAGRWKGAMEKSFARMDAEAVGSRSSRADRPKAATLVSLSHGGHNP